MGNRLVVRFYTFKFYFGFKGAIKESKMFSTLQNPIFLEVCFYLIKQIFLLTEHIYQNDFTNVFN